MRLRLELAYDGTGFAGWARPAGAADRPGGAGGRAGHASCGPTGRRAVTVAGRTDAGVHARGQVAHVDIPAGLIEKSSGRSSRPVDEVLLTRLGGLLPRTSSCTRLTRAAAGLRRPVLRAAPPLHLPDLRRRRACATRCAARTCCGTAAGSTSTRWQAAARPLVGRARLRVVLQAAAGRDDDPHARGVRLVPAGRRSGRRPGGRARCRRTRSATRWCAPWSARASPWGRGVAGRAGRRSCSPHGAATRACTSSPPHGLTLEEVGYPPDERAGGAGGADPGAMRARRGPAARGRAAPADGIRRPTWRVRRDPSAARSSPSTSSAVRGGRRRTPPR